MQYLIIIVEDSKTLFCCSNNFLEMYWKLGHAPAKRFASPALDYMVYSLLSTSRPHQVNSKIFCNCISLLNQSLH